ncbi:MAG: ATP-dependent DNA ligase [Candidatus Bathyarchaeia archaeon]|jgi:DNA ligase-1
MAVSFKALSELLEKVEATNKRLEIIDQVAQFLKTLNADETEPAVNFMVARAFPKHSQKSLDVSWSTIVRILQRITSFNWKLFQSAMAATGDIGSATKKVLENSKTKKQTQLLEQPLTIIEVKRTFEAIAQISGSGARERKERLITALLSQASPVETKYLVKVFTGEMRTGLHEGLTEQAVARAFDVPLLKVQHSSMVLGDIGEVAAAIKTKGAESLETVGFRVFRPVQLMLAQTADSVQEALMEQDGALALEYKYDGARVQIHLNAGKVEVFSRRLTNVTGSLPEVVEVVKQNISAGSAILEGEVISLDASGYPIAFQHLMKRFKRIKDIAETKEKIPLTLILFDILFLNGESLIANTYLKRRQILAQVAGNLTLSQQIVTDQPIRAQEFMQKALKAGHEGLMAKKLDSPYTPGRRGKRWLKIKQVLEPLDLVITAAEYGYGRRKGWLSDYYLAARDPEDGGFLDVGKTFKGLTDAEIVDLTVRLKELAVSQEGHRVTVMPKIVVEVAYNEIQQSPKYKSQMALRFARITRIRDDKSPEQASTIAQVRGIYEGQFNKKGKYKTD